MTKRAGGTVRQNQEMGFLEAATPWETLAEPIRALPETRQRRRTPHRPADGRTSAINAARCEIQ